MSDVGICLFVVVSARYLPVWWWCLLGICLSNGGVWLSNVGVCLMLVTVVSACLMVVSACLMVVSAGCLPF